MGGESVLEPARTGMDILSPIWEIVALGIPLTVGGEGQCLALSRLAVNVWWLSMC